MSFYSKISLFTLMAAGTALGMEQPPRLKHPAQNAAAQAINQPMIMIFSDTHHIDTIQRNYLEASETLKNMFQDIKANHHHPLVLPEFMIEDFLTIKDLFAWEYRFNNNSTDEKTIIEILKFKTEQQLVAIANACQRFELNKVGECAITLLANKLNTQAKKDACLKTGSYHLDWTPDVARLIAQAMIKADPKKTFVKVYWLAKETINKKGSITRVHLDTRGNDAHLYSHTDLFFIQYMNSAYFFEACENSPIRLQTPFRYQKPAEQELIITKLKSAFGEIYFNNNILPRLNYLTFEKAGFTELDNIFDYYYYYFHAESLQKYLETKLKPEELILLEYCFDCKQQKKDFDLEQYPGINRIKQTISPEIKHLLFPTWWHRRSLLCKAAIITSASAATGLAAWFGYKYFTKK